MFEPPQKKELNVNLIPLINVVFLLLIFFLVVGTYTAPDNYETDVPDARTGEQVIDPGHIIMLRKQDMLYNSHKVDENQLLEQLEPLLKAKPKTELLIKANAGMQSDRLIRLMRQLSELGAVNVLLATEVPES